MIRKRTITSIIITIAAIISLNKYWLIFKPMPVSLDICGGGVNVSDNITECRLGIPAQQCTQGKYNISVILNKKDNNDFKKTKHADQDITLTNQTQHLTFYVKRAKYPKRFRLEISGYDNFNPVIVSNIALKNGKLKLNDLNKFEVEGGKSNVVDNKLILYPMDSKITVTCPDTLNIRTSIVFDFKLLVILAVVIYLFTFKLTDYIADFSTLKGKSRLDIIFLTIFFIFLCIPAAKMDNSERTELEARKLAVWHPFIIDNQINYNFGNDFNNWFNDRFNLREPFCKMFINLKYDLNNDYDEVPLGYVYKSNGWMFYTQNQGDVNNTFTPLSSENLNLYTDNIAKLQNYCKNNNIKLYIVILPTKEFLYQDKDKVHKNVKCEKTKALVENVKNKTGVEIIYPVDELLQLKNTEYVCYKTDHHLTDSADLLLYKILMNKIKQDFSDSVITPGTDFNISYNNLLRFEANRTLREGCNYERAGLNDKSLLKAPYKYYDYKYPNKIRITGEFPHYTHFNKDRKYKVFMIGNSFMESLTYFLNTSFNQIDKYRFNGKLDNPQRKYQLDMTGYIPLIEKSKPDILILVLSTGYVDHLGEMFPKEDD